MAAVLAPIIIFWIIWEAGAKDSRPARVIITCFVILNFLAGTWLAYIDGTDAHPAPAALLATLLLVLWIRRRPDS